MARVGCGEPRGDNRMRCSCHQGRAEGRHASDMLGMCWVWTPVIISVHSLSLPYAKDWFTLSYTLSAGLRFCTLFSPHGTSASPRCSHKVPRCPRPAVP